MTRIINERYSDIESELKEIRREEGLFIPFRSNESTMVFFVKVGFSCLISFSIFLVSPKWYPPIFGSLLMLMILYLGAELTSRTRRLQYHLVTVHDETLRTQELILKFSVPKDPASEIEASTIAPATLR